MRLGGWSRIGIIASVVYAVFGFFTEWGVQREATKRYATKMYEMCKATPAEMPSRGYDATDCDQVYAQAGYRRGQNNLSNAGLIALSWLPLVWLAVWLAKRLTPWVREGFELAQTKQ